MRFYEKLGFPVYHTKSQVPDTPLGQSQTSNTYLVGDGSHFSIDRQHFQDFTTLCARETIFCQQLYIESVVGAQFTLS